MDFNEALKLYIDGQQAIINAYWTRSGYTHSAPPAVTGTDGKRYVRIVKTAANGSGRSAMAFIDKTTGDVLKSASWKAPAKHSRGNIFDKYNGLETASAFGPAYLR